MGLRLPRFIGTAADMPAGHYATNPLRHAPGAMLEVAVACPSCGDVTDIAATHVVARDGRVTPAFHCPCGLVEWLDLDGYGQPVETMAETEARERERFGKQRGIAAFDTSDEVS